MPKIVDHAERRAHIAAAATNVISRSGINPHTMREIAEETGYAHGASRRYFPNKRSLLIATFEHLTADVNARMQRQLVGMRGLDALEIVCREILPLEDKGSGHARVLLAFWEHASGEPEILRIHQANNLRWRELMRRFLFEAREDGELRHGVDIDRTVDAIAASNAGWLVTSVLMPAAATRERILAAHAALIDPLRKPMAG